MNERERHDVREAIQDRATVGLPVRCAVCRIDCKILPVRWMETDPIAVLAGRYEDSGWRIRRTKRKLRFICGECNQRTAHLFTELLTTPPRRRMLDCYVDEESMAIADLIHLDDQQASLVRFFVEERDEVVHAALLTRINVPEPLRGQGHGRRLMSQILKEADETETTIFLQASASGGLTQFQLLSWYRRLGFEFKSRYAGVRKPLKAPQEGTGQPL